MDFGSNSYLTKYLGRFKDDHPLLILFDLNPEYMTYFNKLLEDLDKIPNLSSKIKQMRDTSNWQSSVSELEFARDIKELNPEFVQPKKGSPFTDVRLDLLGKELFFEVKLLVETDESARVYKEVWKIPSDFLVEIIHEILDRNKADELIAFVTNKIKNLQTGSFEINGTLVTIRKKTSTKSPRTSLIMRCKEAILISLDSLRRKIFMDFFDKLRQFSSEKFVFWVIDTKRWKYDEQCFKSVVYGNVVTDMTVGLKRYVGFEDIYKIYLKNLELFNNTGIVPTFTYPKKDGLFFLKEATCLNGIIVKSHRRLHFLVNPFADPQIDIAIIRKLRNFCR